MSRLTRKLTNLVEAWLKDSSCDESYRGDIGSHLMPCFRLVAHNKASDAIIDEIDDLPPPSGASARLKEPYSQTEEKGLRWPPPRWPGVAIEPLTTNIVRPSRGNAFLNQALLLGMKEKISWRAFYTNQKECAKGPLP